ncbi:RNA pyrophosphohydrolase [Beggiatoa leptomitoformis]|uniref:RNA pyrophosphohydrolase n=1 Tax=Beggiatoa leptomitoformis TaxID=288004 RepID=A0A2N9YGK7_9GAMM|nr:RNA pyrophosphohydrolase [Beggiatoa leptomitoformis]ALG68337.1 RNA pyrophosphohydrolase [Beggiatoa leptomitoformis]AUI69346.1 RNA pyrophosphohydrolase [Beggiatoa leptomitoformis]
MIDTDGYRLNVGIILVNREGRVFWAKRVGQNAWQFPQGGIKAHEKPEQAVYRELYEEVGLTSKHVKVVGCTKQWLRYNLPKNLIRYHQKPLCIGQKQMWFMLQLACDDSHVSLTSTNAPEFDRWKWVDYWYPLEEVVYFKRNVYENALEELQRFLPVSKKVVKVSLTTVGQSAVIVR